MNKFANNGRKQPPIHEAGQGILEYMIIIALVGLAVVVIVNLMQPAIGNVFSRFVDRANVAPPALVGFSRATPTPTAVPGATLTIIVLPDNTAGTVNVTPGSPQAGDMVTLSAVPVPGWRFTGWGDDLSVSGMQNPVTFYFGSDMTVSANFAPQRYTLNLIPFGLGSVIRTPDQPDYGYNETVLLQAVPNPGSVFFTWGGDVGSTTDNPVTVTMDRNKTVNAYFQIGCYDLVVLKDPAIGGTTSITPNPECNGNTQYEHGVTVNLFAVPAPGYAFGNWTRSGYTPDPTNPALLTMNSAATVTANFIWLEYELTRVINGRGSITVSAEPPYRWGDTVSLTAVPDPGAYFTGWSGAVTGTANPASLTFDGDKSVTASFTNNCYTLSSSVTPANTGMVTFSPTSSPGCGPNQYIYGQTVTLTANPANGYQFNSWSGGATGTNPVTTVTFGTGNISVAAAFEPRCFPFSLTVSPTGSGTASASPASNCANGGYLFNTAVTFTATPNSGYLFGHWSGSATGTTNPTSLTISGPTSVTANFARVLFVVGNPANRTATETAIYNHLLGQGFVVGLMDDDSINVFNPTGLQLIIISPAASANGTTFNTSAVPLILMRRELAGNLRFGTNNNTTSSQQITIVSANNGHPLAAGKSGTIQIYTTSTTIGTVWGLGNGGVSIANQTNNSGRFTIIGYPQGAAMTSGTAPAKRVGFFLEQADLFNTNGWDLFNAAVQWAISN